MGRGMGAAGDNGNHSDFRVCAGDRQRYVLREDLDQLIGELVMCETMDGGS